MFISPYNFIKLSVDTNPTSQNPTKTYYYKFKAAKRSYLVTLEEYSFGITAIKYCDLKRKKDKQAYSAIYNDYDAFRVITTCFFIMADFFKKHRDTSFAFYAVPRKVENKNEKVRFDVYFYGLVNLFDENIFTFISDPESNIGVLLNNSKERPKEALTKLTDYLLANYEIIFTGDYT